MKILHVVINYHPSIGGTQNLFKGISENLVNIYGDEVEVVTIDSYFGSHTKNYKKIAEKNEVINGVFVRRFNFLRAHKKIISVIAKVFGKLTGKASERLAKYYNGPISNDLFKAIRNTDADIVVISPTGFSFSSYPLFREKIMNKKPCVIQGAIHFKNDKKIKVLSEETIKSLKATEYYIANTQYEKDRLIELEVDENSINVVGVAIDVDEFKSGDRSYYRNKLDLKSDDILIGYFGRLETTKSIDVLVKAFASVSSQVQNVKLIIGGASTHFVEGLKKIIDTFPIEVQKKIFFEFNISNSDKVNFFHALDIFVLPSTNESFGIVFLEAWSCKKPVIGANIGAVASVISDGKDGLLMNPFDVDDLSNKLLALAANSELRVELGKNGYSKTKENYTWPIVTKKYRDTYLAAIDKFNHSVVNN